VVLGESPVMVKDWGVLAIAGVGSPLQRVALPQLAAVIALWE